MFARPVVLAVIVLASALAAASAAVSPPGEPCRRESFDGSRFTVCRYAPGEQALRLVSDRGVGSLPDLRASLGASARRVDFAMNAGMYDQDRRPLGLFVVEGRQVRPLNLRSGSGNFFLKPNGVFWVGADGLPHVEETEGFAARRPKAVWATQSGPLLVQGGAIHPKISADGPSRLLRNGVGVRGREALFVISDEPVSFGRFARVLRDDLGCPDALYLDGAVSSLWAPGLKRQENRSGLGTFVVVLSAGAI